MILASVQPYGPAAMLADLDPNQARRRSGYIQVPHFSWSDRRDEPGDRAGGRSRTRDPRRLAAEFWALIDGGDEQ